MVRRYILLLATHRPLQRIGCPSAEYIGPIPAQILCDPHCQKKIGARQSSPPTAHPLLALITLASTKKKQIPNPCPHRARKPRPPPLHIEGSRSRRPPPSATPSRANPPARRRQGPGAHRPPRPPPAARRPPSRNATHHTDRSAAGLLLRETEVSRRCRREPRPSALRRRRPPAALRSASLTSAPPSRRRPQLRPVTSAQFFPSATPNDAVSR